MGQALFRSAGQREARTRHEAIALHRWLRAIGGQWLNSQDANAEVAPADLKESYYCGMELAEDHPWAVRRLRSFGHNQWPKNLLGFREQMLAYCACVNEKQPRRFATCTVAEHVNEMFRRSYGFEPNAAA